MIEYLEIPTEEKENDREKKRTHSNNLILKGRKKDGTFQWQYGE